ncbi:hypothetical protein PUN28_013985 [Cardiocondyla obscurior]|uniref:Reverse transcriptase domain-containing protein n=1 Tax=Cardiocondyla obscurior TaxID=286306 RepID=A0AAW2F493_9HYME
MVIVFIDMKAVFNSVDRKNLEEYVEEKGLEVNVEKTTILRCRKRGGRWKKVRWNLKEKKIKEVKSFKEELQRKIERKSRNENLEIRDEIEKRKRGRISEMVLGGYEEKGKRRTSEWKVGKGKEKVF